MLSLIVLVSFVPALFCRAAAAAVAADRAKPVAADPLITRVMLLSGQRGCPLHCH